VFAPSVRSWTIRYKLSSVGCGSYHRLLYLRRMRSCFNLAASQSSESEVVAGDYSVFKEPLSDFILQFVLSIVKHKP